MKTSVKKPVTKKSTAKKSTAKKTKSISVSAQAVLDAELPKDKSIELTMPQAAKLLGITQYAAYRILNYEGLPDRTLGSWLKFKTK